MRRNVCGATLLGRRPMPARPVMRRTVSSADVDLEACRTTSSVGTNVEPYRRYGMSRLRFRISMSLDGYVAGPNQSIKEPLGVGGERLHDWVVPLAEWRS